jgi:hypothetical protein
MKIACVLKGPKKKPFILYHGGVRELTFDPCKWTWEDGNILHDFTTSKKKMMFNSKIKLKKNVTKKWSNVIPSSFELKWKDVWMKVSVKKDVGFI